MHFTFGAQTGGNILLMPEHFEKKDKIEQYWF
jgi:hypothetical protein